jgi:GntR family transcriptional regulator/MocR family aminotransferase
LNIEEFDALRDFCFSGTDSKQHQLYLAIKERILDGRLNAGARLPSSRSLSGSLPASRNTVSGAFEQLKAEGYIQTKKGSGHYVADNLPDDFLKTQTTPSSTFTNKRAEMPLSDTGKGLLKDGKIRIYHSTSFEAGLPDLNAFPIKKWSQIYHRHSQRTSLLGYDSLQGSAKLREVLASYLRTSRGLDCSPEQIIITVGAQQAVSIAIQVILNQGDEVYLENPGYIGMREAFKAHQCQITGIPIGKDGLDISALPERPKGKLLCVTPTHQYPMGGIMPLANRLKILQWAAENGVWILEDDYDSEYHYDHKPIASVQGLGLSEQVIYIGSFSKVLYPALRLGYMVVPENIVTACVKTKNRIAGQTPMIEQETVAEFIGEGHFVRHLRKMRGLYHEKFKTIIASCSHHLAGLAIPEYTGAGMHIVLLFNPQLCKAGLTDMSIVEAMRKRNLFASPLSAYYIGQAKEQGLVLGFANTELDQIDAHIKTLKQIILSCIN